MKIFFLENDSFHKIYKTIEKLPDHKKATCFLENTNPIFDNNRQGKQIKNLIENKKISITRIAKSEKEKRFFSESGLQYKYKHKSKVEKNIKSLYRFIFKGNPLYNSWSQKTKFTQKITRAAEYAIFIAIMYLVYIFIRPSATIEIKPTNNLQKIVYNFRYYPKEENVFENPHNHLSIPYQIGEIKHVIKMKQPIQNIIDTQQYAKGNVTLYNTSKITYKIIANTTFITESGVLFQAPKKFTIPARISENTPSKVSIDLIAKSVDVNNNAIGEKGNIPKDTMLYIKNIGSSYLLKNIYAKATKNFTGGKTKKTGKVSQKDIDTMKKKITDQAKKQTKSIIKKEFNIPGMVLLHFDELFDMKIGESQINQKPEDEVSEIEGSLEITYTFPYVKKDDIIEQFEGYIRARSSGVEKLVDIQSNSLTLHDVKDSKQSDKDITPENKRQFIIPTEVTTIQTYDFERDSKEILPKIKKEILGKTKKGAKSIINQYSEISTVYVDINPGWTKEIPITKSRIFFNIQ